MRNHSMAINHDEPSFTSRRRVLQTIGVGSLGVLAGCAEDTDPADEDRDIGPADRTYTGWTDRNPEREGFNVFNSDDSLYGVINHNGLSMLHDKQDFYPEGFADWGLEGTTATIEIQDWLTWHNGDPYTSEDLEATVLLRQLQGTRPYATLLTEDPVSIIDDKTVELALERPAEPHSFWVPFVYGSPLGIKADQWTEYLERLEDTTDDDELAELRQDMRERRFDDPIGNSAWMPDRMTGSRAIFTLWDDHEWADEYEHHTLESLFITTSEGIYERILTENIDSGYGRMPRTTLNQMPDSYQTYLNPWWWGMGFGMHQDMFPSMKVRKAMMYALDKPIICENSGIPEDVLSPKPVVSGIYGDEERHTEIVGDLWDNYEVYDQDQDRAEEYLADEGYTKEDGQWYQPNGDPFEFTIVVPSQFGYYTPMSETVQAQLGEIGIEVDLTIQEAGVYYGQTKPLGEFEMLAAIAHGGTWNPAVSLGYNHAPDLVGSFTVNNGMPLENLPLPMPVGDPNGDIEEVNLVEYINQLDAPDDEGGFEARRIVSWACNQHPYYYEMSEHFNVIALYADRWDGPDPDGNDPRDEFAGTNTDALWWRRPILRPGPELS